MHITRFTGGTLESNGYVLFVRQPGHCYLIDPGYEPQKFIRFLEAEGLEPLGILLTHHHYDHTGGVARIKSHFDCPVFIHEKDRYDLPFEVDGFLQEGQQLDLDGETLTILWTPGHTPGSICILNTRSRDCFTGDTLFDTDLGRTDLPGGSEADMTASVQRLNDQLAGDIHIWPGHDEGCTMKVVRQGNEEFLALVGGKAR